MTDQTRNGEREWKTTRSELQANQAVWDMFYSGGKTLGEIAEHFGVSIYDLSPWLYSPAMRGARHGEALAAQGGGGNGEDRG